MTAKNRYETLQSMPMGRVLLKLKPTCATFSIYRFFMFQMWVSMRKERKTNDFSHSACSKKCGNKFVNHLSNSLLKAVIGKVQYGFVFHFS